MVPEFLEKYSQDPVSWMDWSFHNVKKLSETSDEFKRAAAEVVKNELKFGNFEIFHFSMFSQGPLALFVRRLRKLRQGEYRTASTFTLADALLWLQRESNSSALHCTKKIKNKSGKELMVPEFLANYPIDPLYWMDWSFHNVRKLSEISDEFKKAAAEILANDITSKKTDLFTFAVFSEGPLAKYVRCFVKLQPAERVSKLKFEYSMEWLYRERARKLLLSLDSSSGALDDIKNVKHESAERFSQPKFEYSMPRVQRERTRKLCQLDSTSGAPDSVKKIKQEQGNK
ncbi:hypothetical protein O6P43_000795 [Quillaja saponaria]|uniref:Uncharacterized protein n=1 Tax=Quillaja saponaria TaxID=32244 RepID=A0AAD7VN66_QUISA|nr:hypothetical protein O6P43_000795 [Quillaja saponaria]